MDFNYNKVANALYIRFSSEKVVNSDEIANGIIIVLFHFLKLLKF